METGDAAKHPKASGSASTTKDRLDPNVSNAAVEITSPGISEPALQSPGNLRGWAQAPQRCWLSRGTAERAHAGEGIGGILPVLMWPVSDLEWACTDRWVAPCHMCTFTPNSQAEGWPDLLGT